MSGAETKYGKRNVKKMIQQFNDLRQSCRAEGTPAIQDALDKVEEHIDYAYSVNPAQIRADALREAAALMEVAATNCRAAFTYPPRTKEERDYQTGALIHTYARNAILSLIDTPPSPPAVDGSPAPDAGGKP